MSRQDARVDDASTYDAAEVEAKWRALWQSSGLYRVDDTAAGEKRYALTMFPYPSGDLHMGHAEVTSLHDVLARYWRQRGFQVLNPMGFDSFGLPAENAAIRNDEHPATYTDANIETATESFKHLGASFDWSRTFNTSDPSYYRWTQWLFLRFREMGLAYRKQSPVNWCPEDQTVLANEQVVEGRCERCGAEVTKRDLTQWYFRITRYAQELLDGLDDLASRWPAPVINAQRNWIGRSEGAEVDFEINTSEGVRRVRVFTTRPDTVHGVTFLVVAADAELAAQVVSPERRAVLQDYVAQVRAASDIERLATGRKMTGVDLGVTAVNPVTGDELPVWASDYVLSDYGTGVIMAVPAHDQRDLDFATAMGLPVRRVIDSGVANPQTSLSADTGEGTYIHPGLLHGLTDRSAAAEKVIQHLTVSGCGARSVQYRLRDWLLSRQRYWGTPIPIIHCPACGEVPVPEDQLPVTLPDLRGADLAPKGVSPLAAAADWVNVACPECGTPASRDTDTMDTFVDSSWYMFRFCSPDEQTRPFDSDQVNAWMPCDVYVGGVEHAVLHLLYSRFFTKVLRDMGMIDFSEPFTALMNQGMVINRGKKMSKSLGNGVRLGEQLHSYGVDAIRLTLIFAGPPEDDIDWAEVSPAGAQKFLQRAWRLAGEIASSPGSDPAGGDRALRQLTHRTIADAETLLESHRFNVLVARIMSLVNATRKRIDDGGAADPAVREAAEVIAILLSLMTPYVAEEMWQRLGHEPSVANAGWPTVDRGLLVQDQVTAIIQVDGKLRARLQVPPDISDADLKTAALSHEAIREAMSDTTPRRVVIRAPKLVNVVTR